MLVDELIVKKCQLFGCDCFPRLLFYVRVADKSIM